MNLPTLQKSYTLSSFTAVFALHTLRILALASIVQQALEGVWDRIPLLLFWFILTYSANVIGGLKKVRVPFELEALVVAFVFATMFLGEFRNFYDEVRWWDSFLHIAGSAIMAFTGFILFTNFERRPFLNSQPLLLSFVCFCFAMTMGSLWEIYEFFMDTNFGLNMQPAGNTDTMWDTIWNLVGGIAASSVIYLHKLNVRFFSLSKFTESLTLERPNAPQR